MENFTGNSDPATRLERARLYTQGDKNLAIKMIQGQYKDVVLIKLGFIAEDTNIKGFATVFINLEKRTLNNFFLVTTRGGGLSVDITHKPWQEFLYNILKVMYSEENDVTATGRLKSEIEREFTPALITVLTEKILAKDTHSISIQFEKIIGFVLKSHSIKLNVVQEKTSSLHVDEAVENIKNTINQASIEETQAKAEEKTAEPASEQKPNIIAQREKELMDQGYRIIDCKLVLSPVRGKFVSQLIPGDIVRIRLKGETATDIKIAEKLGWLEAGKMKSGKARIHSKDSVDVGNVIYVQIANNLYGKILEEEEVRVYVLNDIAPVQKQKSGGKTALIWILVIAVILGIIGVMVMIN